MKGILLLTALLSLFSNPSPIGSHDLTVIITGIRNSKGEVDLKLYHQAEGFPKDETKAFKHIRGKIKDGICTVVFQGIPQGKYAVSIYHDTNNDHIFNATWYGKPIEGVGISNGAKGGLFGPPSYEDASFDFNADMEITIEIIYL